MRLNMTHLRIREAVQLLPVRQDHIAFFLQPEQDRAQRRLQVTKLGHQNFVVTVA